MKEVPLQEFTDVLISHINKELGKALNNPNPTDYDRGRVAAMDWIIDMLEGKELL